MKAVVEINPLLCTGCRLCVEVCSKSVLFMDDFTGLCKVRHPENCDRNGACVRVCKTKAIRIN